MSGELKIYLLDAQESTKAYGDLFLCSGLYLCLDIYADKCVDTVSDECFLEDLDKGTRYMKQSW